MKAVVEAQRQAADRQRAEAQLEQLTADRGL